METEAVLTVVNEIKNIITPIGETVFEAYMKQVMIEGAFGTIISIAIGLTLTYATWRSYKYMKPMVNNGSMSNEDFIGSTVIIIVLYIFAIAITCDIMISSITMLVNPEYHVITRLLSIAGM